MDRRAILEQLRDAHYKASLAVDHGHRENRVELVEAGEEIAREVVETLKALDAADRAERRRWETRALRNASIMLRKRLE